MKKTYKLLIALLLSLVLISCNSSDQSATTLIPQFVKQKVILASGYNFKTKEMVVLDTVTGNEIVPCKINNVQTSAYNKGESQEENIKCKSQVIEASDSLKQALKLSETPIESTILVDGVNKKATFLIDVTAIYEGSYCITKFSAGKQREKCIDKEMLCQAIAAAGINEPSCAEFSS